MFCEDCYDSIYQTMKHFGRVIINKKREANDG
jgi:hypothetical protein